MEEEFNDEIIEDSNDINSDEEITQEPIELQQELTDVPAIDYTEQLEAIRNNLRDINDSNVEQTQILTDLFFSLDSETLTEYQVTHLSLLETMLQENTGEMVVNENAEYYETAEFYGNLSIIVILSLITIAMTWKFVYVILSTFTRFIG